MISGHVYVLECEGFVKIGYSAEPSKRIANLRVKLKSKHGRSFISDYCEFATDYERSCHREFSELCVGNERFLTGFDEAVSAVKRMNPSGLSRDQYVNFVYREKPSVDLNFIIEEMQKDTMAVVNKYARDTPIYDIALRTDNSIIEMITIQNEARKYRLMLLEALDQIDLLKKKIGVN